MKKEYEEYFKRNSEDEIVLDVNKWASIENEQLQNEIFEYAMLSNYRLSFE